MGAVDIASTALFLVLNPHNYTPHLAPMALSDDTVKEIQEYLEVQGFKWAREFIAGRKAWLQSKGIAATGDLIDSLGLEVTSTLENALITRIEIEFATYGRYLDMKMKPAKGGSDYIQGIVQWMEDKGFETKFINDFLAKRKRRTITRDKVLNQIAWGIAIKRSIKYKRRVWWNKPKSAAISDLYNRVAAGLPDKVLQEIKKAFKTK